MASSTLTMPSVFNQTTAQQNYGNGFAKGPVTKLSTLPQWDQLLGEATQDLFDTNAQVTEDQYAAEGSEAAAQGYSTAAGIAGANVGLEAQSTALQLSQAKRTEYQAIGSEKADTSAAGLQGSGTAMDLMRSSVSQAGLTNQTIALQGQINENGYAEQSAAFSAQANAASISAAGDTAAEGIAENAGQSALNLLTQQAQGIVNNFKTVPGVSLGGIV